MLASQKKLSNSFLTILSLPATAMGFALCVQIAALSWILNTKYGFNIEKIGFVWLAGPLAGILGQVIVGAISDKTWFWGGRRRPFILIGGTIAAMMILALPQLDVINNALGLDNLVGIALTVALTLDLAINVSFNPTRTLITDVTPSGVLRTKGYTWMQTISGFFGVLAYLLGAFVSNYALIYAGAVFVLLASVIPIFFIEEPRSLEANESENNDQITQTNAVEFVKIGLANAFSWIGIQTMFIYTFAYIKEVIMGFPADAVLAEDMGNQIGKSIGIAFAILNTVGFLSPTFILQPLVERIGKVRTQTLGVASMAIGYAMIVFFGKSIGLFYFFMMIIGIGWGAVVSLPYAMLSEVVAQKRMGFFMGLFNLFVVVPQLLSSLLGKYIEHHADKSIIFTISCITLSISAALWLLVKERQK
jgi:maltose/moltooligosaccharide transporter